MRVFVSAKEGEPDGNGGRWPDAIEVVIPARELITDWANWAVIEIGNEDDFEAAAGHAASLPEGDVRVLLRSGGDLFEGPRVRLSPRRIRQLQTLGDLCLLALLAAPYASGAGCESAARHVLWPPNQICLPLEICQRFMSRARHRSPAGARRRFRHMPSRGASDTRRQRHVSAASHLGGLAGRSTALGIAGGGMPVSDANQRCRSDDRDEPAAASAHGMPSIFLTGRPR